MNDRRKLRDALVELIRAAVPSEVSVIPVMNIREGDTIKEPRAILVARESIDTEPFEQANPPVGCVQSQLYTWALRYIGGGGGRTPRARLDALDDLLDTVETALAAQRLTGSARVGPLEMLPENEGDEHSSGVSVVQRWRNEKHGEIE